MQNVAPGALLGFLGILHHVAWLPDSINANVLLNFFNDSAYFSLILIFPLARCHI